MNNIENQNSIYATIEEVAKAKGVSCRAIRKSYKKYKYINSTNPNGGKKILIFISSLEPQIQEKIYNTTHPRGEIQAYTSCPSFSLNFKNEPAIPLKIKNIAFAKADLIQYWQDYRKSKPSKTRADNDFIKFYNNGTLNQTLLNIVGEIKLRTLYGWKKELEENNNNPIALIPKYKYSSDLVCNTKMSDIEKQIFTNIVLKNNKIKVGRAYEYVKFKLQEQGINEISSVATYRRVWQHLNKKHHSEVVYAREGMKAARETMPSIMRDVSKLEVGDVLIADGHTVDFDLINPYTGKAQRMTLIAFIDWASWDIMGWEIMPTENTQAIASAFRNAVLRLGKMPKVVYLDNGRAFRGKFFSGYESFMSVGMNGLYKSLGIDVKYTQAYNGQAKIIERFFREFTESFAVMQNFYRGNSINNKPAYLMRNEKFHLSLKGNLEPPTIQEFKQSFEDWLDNIYRTRTSKKDKAMTIAELFTNGKGAGINENLLDDFIMASDIRSITKDGIRMFNTFYWCDEICGMKLKVRVKYSLFDLTKIKIYSPKGVYIGTAKTRTLVHGMVCLSDNPIDYTTLKAELKAQKDRQKTHLAGIKSWLSNGKKEIRTIKAKKIKTVEESQILQHTNKKTVYDITEIGIYKDLEMPKVREF